MNIDWVIPCRYLEVHDNLGTIVGAGIDTIWVELPTPIQIVLAIRLVGPADEFTLDADHSATNRVTDPQGQVIGEISGDFKLEAQSARPEWLTGIIMPAVVQFDAEEEGTYSIEQTVDGASHTVPIHIVHGAPGA